MVHVPGNSKRRESGEIGDLQWEEKWKAMMSELGKDAKISDLWRMPALLNIYRRIVKEQMMMSLYEIGESYENLKAKVVAYTTNKTKQTRGGQRDVCTDGGRPF